MIPPLLLGGLSDLVNHWIFFASDMLLVVMHFHPAYLLTQNLPILEAIKQCKCMVNLKDFPLVVHCLGWSYNDP